MEGRPNTPEEDEEEEEESGSREAIKLAKLNNCREAQCRGTVESIADSE